MLFIIQHHVAELWMKLIVHELQAAIAHVRADRSPRASRSRPREADPAAAVRAVGGARDADALGVRPVPPRARARPRAAVHQFRAIEFLLGNKDPAILAVHRHDPALHAWLERPAARAEPVRRVPAPPRAPRHALPPERLERDWSQPYGATTASSPRSRRSTTRPSATGTPYDMCEKLVDVEENFQLWRFRHVKTVERVIGFKRGTGGTAGVSFLRKTLEVALFPELIEVRTSIGSQ
jgi:tryptophan 2,3-dioxygenase